MTTTRAYTQLFLLCGACAFSGVAAPRTPSTSAWTPSRAYLSQLAATTKVGAYQLRPPKGYTRQHTSGPDQAQVVGWVSSPRPNGVRSYLMLAVVNVPKAPAKKYSVEQILNKFLQGIQRSRGKDWRRTATEHGQIGGLAFVRARWSGTEPKGGFKMHGFNYVGLVDGHIIQLSSQDIEPHYQEPLALAEAAALTFKVTTHK